MIRNCEKQSEYRQSFETFGNLVRKEGSWSRLVDAIPYNSNRFDWLALRSEVVSVKRDAWWITDVQMANFSHLEDGRMLGMEKIGVHFSRKAGNYARNVYKLSLRAFVTAIFSCRLPRGCSTGNFIEGFLSHPV